MGDPMRYLPNCSIEDIKGELARIQFPTPSGIKPFTSTGSYHKIYRLTYARERYDEILKIANIVDRSQADSSDLVSNTGKEGNTPGEASLVLRVSGNHIPAIKTSNEVGILAYLQQNTSIPVPSVIHHDLTRTNLLKNEYMITTFAQGQNGSDIYASLTDTQMSHILSQLATICLDLYKLDFTHIGGLKPAIDSPTTPFPQKLQNLSLHPGPPVMETMWQTPDIETHFTNHDASITFATLNAVSPTGYPDYTTWLAAQTTCYQRAITTHPSLHWLHTPSTLAALARFTSLLLTSTPLQSRLNAVPLRLIHGDLHFGNMLLAPDPHLPGQYRISAVLDWEFANVLPYPFWGAGFLYRAGAPAPGVKWDWAAARTEKNRVQGMWRERVKEIGGEEAENMLRDMEWQSVEQERAWDVVNYLRCVVEVCPRDKQWEDARGWWKEVEKGLRGFGIEIGEMDGKDQGVEESET